jgi:hypothetical protein
MSTEYHWERIETIEATDDKGNSYYIEKEQWVGTIFPISGGGGPRSARGGKVRFSCEDQPVKQLPDGKFKLVMSGIILTPRSAP